MTTRKSWQTANGYPFLVVGEHLQTVGNMTFAGQGYVYKMNCNRRFSVTDRDTI